MKYWRISFNSDGSVKHVRPIKVPKHRRWVIVQADTQEEAERLAYNVYCKRKKREARARLEAEGKCRCGRDQDREGKKQCSVCAERAAPQKADLFRRQQEAKESGMPFVPKTRNETVRVEACKERVRDRKSEMRLEVLCEVRKAWENARNNGAFTKWLADAIVNARDAGPADSEQTLN